MTNEHSACHLFDHVCWIMLCLIMCVNVQPLITTEWGYHTARVNSVAWSPDSRHIASGALDTNAIVWTPGSKTNYTVVKGITCLQSCIPVAISWTQLIAFYLHNLIRWKGRNKFPCLSVIIIISVSFSQTPVHTAWQGGLRVHSPAFTSEDFEPSAGWLGRSRWLVMTLVQRQLPTHPFTVPCGLWGGKNKACSVSWSKVVNGIPNHGVVFVI